MSPSIPAKLINVLSVGKSSAIKKMWPLSVISVGVGTAQSAYVLEKDTILGPRKAILNVTAFVISAMINF